jgi:DNA (cytosine-5)-methyltransferase 1
MTLTVGSLFSGIGGLDLGLERAGMKVIWQSEIDPYACKVLKKHWPEVPNHGDIKQIDWRTVEPVDVICGGYPCQPFSTAGKRRGTEDPRHLWPWVRTAISELRPQYAILENVRGHLTMGGLQVIGELAEIGYDAEWRVISAAGLGAPHRRDRIIIVAYPTELLSNGSNNNARVGMESQTISQFGDSSRSENVANTNGGDASNGRQRANVQGQNRSRGDDRSRSGSNLGQISLGSSREGSRDVADTCEQQPNGRGHQHGAGTIEERQTIQEQVDRSSSNVAYSNHGGHVYAQIEKQPDIGRRSKEIGRLQWEVEPDVGRVADGIPNRVDRLKGLGNAVVPQVAEYIGRLITTSLDA